MLPFLITQQKRRSFITKTKTIIVVIISIFSSLNAYYLSRRIKGEGLASRRAFNEGVNGKRVEFIYIVQTSLIQLSQTLLVGAAYPTAAGLTI